MDALGQLAKAAGQGRVLTMAEKEQMKEFDRFSRALTNSLPARIARGDETCSSDKPDVYLLKASKLRRVQQKVSSRSKSPLPKNVQTVLNLQTKSGKKAGQWKPTKKLREALGGFLPKPQFGINAGTWTTAVVLSFLKRQPELYTKTIAAYTKGSMWVTDGETLKLAGQALPPVKGSWTELAKKDPEKAAIIGKSGTWKQCVQYNAETFGYLPFSNEGGRQDDGRMLTAESRAGFPAVADARGEDSRAGIFTREAEQRMAARIAAESKKLSTFKTDAQYLAEENRRKRKKKMQNDWDWRMKALQKEFKHKSNDPGKSFLVNERVKTKYRRASEWDRPRLTNEYHPARVIRLGADGQTVDLQYLDKRKEVERRVKKSVVEADMIEFARMSIEINKRNFDKKAKAKAIQDEKDKFEAELLQLKEQAVKKGGAAALEKADKEAREQLALEDAAKTKNAEVEVEEEDMRLHEGLNSIASEWVEPMSLRSERKRLKEFMAGDRADFDTRLCGQTNPSMDTLKLRRDHTDLRYTPKKKKVVERKKTMEEMLAENQAASAAAEAAAIDEVGKNKKARVVAGGKKNELIRRQFEEEQRKQKQLLKDLMDGVVNAENSVVACMLAHEKNVLLLQDELEKAVDQHARAALRTEQIHAFDLVTQILNDGRNINCDLIEAVSGWRSAKIALAEHRGEKIPVTVKYAEEDDDQAEELGPLPHPSAPPFIWEGANVLFKIITDFDFIDRCEELKTWYGPDFPMLSNPFMLAVPLWNRPPTPRKSTQTVLVNGVSVERIIPRLRERNERQAKALKAVKTEVEKAPWWWPGKGIKPSEYERVRRGEKEIFDEQRREKIRW